ncbi:MAG: ATP-binding protein [Dokdonella sp.]
MPETYAPRTLDVDDLQMTGVARVTADLRIASLNPALAELLATGMKRWIGAPLATLDDQPPRLQRAAQRALDEHRSVLLLQVRLASGGERELICDLALSPLDEGLLLEVHPTANAVRSVAASNDLSASLRGLAHEIKNPLAGMRGAAQLLQRRVVGEELSELAGLIIAEADRLAALADRLLIDGAAPRRKPINIHEPLERVAALVGAEPQAPHVQRDYDPSLPTTLGDSDRLQQLFLNLTCNAVEAGARTITLRTRVEHGVRVGTRLRRQALRIEVIDDGRGVPTAIAETLYQPLVSGRANGTGLGLALAREIAAEHDGELRHTSQPGVTTFTLLLPSEPSNEE